MVDREADGGALRQIPRIGRFLEIGVQSDGEIEEDAVQNVEDNGHPCIFDQGITQKKNKEAGALQGEDHPLAVNVDGPGDVPVGQVRQSIIQDIDAGNGADAQPVFFDEKEDGKDNENLPPGATEKVQDIVQPVFPAEDEFVLPCSPCS